MMVVALNTLIERSLKNMGNVHPSLKEYTKELLTRCYKEGIYVQISSGYRSNEEQARIYGQGRPDYVWNDKKYGSKGSIVSKAEPGTSVHNYGLAIDYFIVSDDGNKAIWTVNDKWKRVAAIAKSMGFEWGGDWVSFRDYPHLQFTKGLSIASLKAGKRPTFPPLKKAEVKVEKPKPAVKPATTTKGIYRIKTGTFKNAQELANAIKKVENDFGILTYERADSTGFDPSYRIYTGTFATKESAEVFRKKLKDKYGWTTHLIDETKGAEK